MTPENFCLWLKGFFDLAGDEILTEPTPAWRMDIVIERLTQVCAEKPLLKKTRSVEVEE